jgi:hypothetical protein
MRGNSAEHNYKPPPRALQEFFITIIFEIWAVVELSELNSNHLDAVIRFKKSLAADTKPAAPADIVPPAERKANGYGEIYVSKMQQKQKRLTEDEIRLLIADYQAGKSTYTLASEFDCHRQTVSELLRKLHFSVNPPGSPQICAA